LTSPYVTKGWVMHLTCAPFRSGRATQAKRLFVE